MSSTYQMPLAESPTPTPMHTARNSVEGGLPSQARVDSTIEEASECVPGLVTHLVLLLYFSFNVSLTMHNKAVLEKLPLPYLLTALHAASGCVGCCLLRRSGWVAVRRLSSSEFSIIFFFSTLYTINIAISNVSLNMVTVPFHQVLRGTAPVVTALIYAVVYHKIYPVKTYVCLAPVIVGVGFATYGDYHASALGAGITVAGTMLASAKTIAAHRIQTGHLHFTTLELLYHLSPLALVQSLACAWAVGEFTDLSRFVFDEGRLTMVTTVLVLLNGMTAFGLNVTSFMVNKRTGALTMAVAANVKQVLVVVLGVFFFRVHVGLANGFGMMLTLCGGACYAKVELHSRRTPPSLLPQHHMRREQ